MSKRIYRVDDESTEDSSATKTTLVRASNRHQAIAHVVRSRFTAWVAGQEEIVALIGAGVVMSSH